jgi:hypothetical protein
MKSKLSPYSCPKCGGLEVDKELSSSGDRYLFIPEDGQFYWQPTDTADFDTTHVSCADCGEDVAKIFRRYEDAGLVN